MMRSPLAFAVNQLRKARCRRQARAQAARIPGSTPIFVHSHGKVGSSTIRATLHGYVGNREPIFQTHALSADGRMKARQKAHHALRDGPRPHLIMAEEIAPYLDALPFPCHVVTATRDPVDRAISHTFQTLRDWLPNARVLPPDVLTQRARERVDYLLSGSTDVSDPADWFDQEMEGVFGIDAFAHPYDFERGYQLLTNGPVRALIIRREDFDRALGPALSALMERPIAAPTQNANVGSAKWYGPALLRVKLTYEPSSERAERVIAGRYYQHFYASDPIKERPLFE